MSAMAAVDFTPGFRGGEGDLIWGKPDNRAVSIVPSFDVEVDVTSHGGYVTQQRKSYPWPVARDSTQRVEEEVSNGSPDDIQHSEHSTEHKGNHLGDVSYYNETPPPPGRHDPDCIICVSSLIPTPFATPCIQWDRYCLSR